jgi:hypothetical protein
MGKRAPTFRNWFLSFGNDWTELMSGGASVPFAALAVFVEDAAARAIFAVMAVVTFVFAAYRVWRAERIKVNALTKSISPQFRLSFNPRDTDYPGIVVAREVSLSASGQPLGSRAANYVRVWVHATASVPVLDCSAAIVNFSLKDEEHPEYWPLVLPQIVQIGPPKFDVKPGMPVHLDFLVVDSKHKKLRTAPGVAWPLVLESIFDIAKNLRFDIVVSGGACNERIRIEIDWTGDWTKLDGREIATS